jgi:hypothetical protein
MFGLPEVRLSVSSGQRGAHGIRDTLTSGRGHIDAELTSSLGHLLV